MKKEPKWKQCPAVDVTGDGSKLWCCKEQYCIGTWNVRSMNQDNSVEFNHSVMSDSLRPRELQHTRCPCPSPTSGVHPNPHPLNQWCHPTISSSVIPFSSCLQSFPASGCVPMSWLFTLGGHSIGTSASILPVNIQGWFSLGLTGFVSLKSKELSSLLQYYNLKGSILWYSAFLWSKSHIHTWHTLAWQ